MKLIFCPVCNDVFKLAQNIRTCKCGKCRAKYIDNSKAVTNGKGICLAISNHSLAERLFVNPYDFDCKRNIECWIRPHTGEHNPNTTIDEDL